MRVTVTLESYICHLTKVWEWMQRKRSMGLCRWDTSNRKSMGRAAVDEGAGNHESGVLVQNR